MAANKILWNPEAGGSWTAAYSSELKISSCFIKTNFIHSLGWKKPPRVNISTEYKNWSDILISFYYASSCLIINFIIQLSDYTHMHTHTFSVKLHRSCSKNYYSAKFFNVRHPPPTPPPAKGWAYGFCEKTVVEVSNLKKK